MSASSAAGKLKEDLSELSAAQLELILAHWPLWARPDQLPPATTEAGEPWRVWLILGGRGAGKTRAGAEWVRAKALGRMLDDTAGAKRIALVGETIGDVRRVMIEGVSGLLGVHGPRERPQFEPSKGQLVWPTGAIAQMFSAEDPDSLRGPQFDAAWCDEIAKWRHPERTFNMLQFALRLGARPQMVATTTPRSTPFLKKLIADTGTVVTRAATAANADNLAPTFVTEMTRRYAGTALGRQELMGELVDDTSGALWRRDWIDAHRVSNAPELGAVVVAVDPPVTATVASDACGIIIAGRGIDGRAYVLADRTLQGREPQVWARAAIAAYRDFLADRVVAEVNQGGDLVVSILKQIDENVPVRTVRATRGKWLRAEPVAALYAPTLDELSFPTTELYAMPAATSSLLDDSAVNIDEWLAEEVRIAFAEQEGTAFVTGNGTNKPKGFLAYTAVANASWTWGNLGFIATGADGAFPASDPADKLIDLIYALKAGYRANAHFVMNRATQSVIRKMKDGDDNYLWQPSGKPGEAPTLMGYPIAESEDMPNMAADSLSVAFGDFRRGYLIVDRVGIRVLRDPYSAKPYVLFYTTKRVGGGVADFEAIKLLKFGD